MAEKTRKAVTTMAEVKDAWECFVSTLRDLKIDTSDWRLIQPVEGGFEILGTNLPERVPLRYANKEIARDTFIMWSAVVILVTRMAGLDTAPTELTDEETPEVVAETPAEEVKPTPKRRRITANA